MKYKYVFILIYHIGQKIKATKRVGYQTFATLFYQQNVFKSKKKKKKRLKRNSRIVG